MALYSDIDLSFIADATTRDLTVLTDEAAVAQSVKNLVLTSFYERPFQPAIGSAVNLLLFEDFNPVTEMVLAQKIKEVVDLYEPRAQVKFVDIYTSRGPSGEILDEHTLFVDIGFRVYNLPTLTTTQVILRRLR